MKAKAWCMALMLGAIGQVQAQQPPPPLGLPPVPPANPVTPAKANLGKVLFWEEQLSVTGTVACGSCHGAAAGGADPRTRDTQMPELHPGLDMLFQTPDDVHGSPGVAAHGQDGNYTPAANFGLLPQVGRRKAQSAVNAGYSPLLFWDGRAGPTFLDPLTNQPVINQGGALENQALGPLLDASEMAPAGASANQIAARLIGRRPLALAAEVPATLSAWIGGREYPALFQEAFSTEAVTPARIALAIATYERTLNANQTPIDSQFGGTPSLTQLELQGQQVFLGNDCAGCHAGNLFSDNQFHYIGLRPADEDLGRFNLTGNPADRGAFRTPSLRNAGLRSPYMHNGRFATLEEVVEFYNRGGDFNAPNKDPRVRARNLTPQQKTALLAFLRRPLTDARAAAETAPFDRPKLFTESARVPELVGPTVAGSGGRAPRMIALEPPLLGNANFTVALADAVPGANARLVVGHADPGAQAPVPHGDFANIERVASDLGHASVQLDLTGDLLGHTLYGRWYVADALAPQGLAISNAFRVTVFDGGDRISADGFE